MSTKKSPARIMVTPRPKKRRTTLRSRRVLSLAQAIFIHDVMHPSEYSTQMIAMAALKAAETFWDVATPRTKRKGSP